MRPEEEWGYSQTKQGLQDRIEELEKESEARRLALADAYKRIDELERTATRFINAFQAGAIHSDCTQCEWVDGECSKECAVDLLLSEAKNTLKMT